MEVVRVMESWERGGSRVEQLLPLLRAYGTCPTSFLALDPRKSISSAPHGEGFLTYVRAARANVVLGEPVCPPDLMVEMLEEFTGWSRARKQTVLAFPITSDGAIAYLEAGFRGFEGGAEAVVDLCNFTLEDPRRKNLRRSARHASREGVMVEEIRPSLLGQDELSGQFSEITCDWLRSRKTGLLSFIVGEPFMPGFQECRYFLARTGERIEAFAVFYPVYPAHAVYMDLTRRRLNSPNGTMDLLLSEALKAMASDGVLRAYLGMIPCALSGAPRNMREVVMRSIFMHFQALYPMRTEYFFKRKFAPVWEPRFVFSSSGRSVRDFLAIFRALWPDGFSSIARQKLAQLAGG